MSDICEKTGKVQYMSKADASAANANLYKRMTKNRKKLEVYRCPHCNRFHIGHRDVWGALRRRP